MENGKLPYGTSDFVILRHSGEIYVDKTDFIFELASERGKIFLSRPRRFGKSLLVSTFETLFKDGLKYFEGLKIAEKWRDTTYGVVKLDFSDFKDESTIGEMRIRFHVALRSAFENVGFIYKPDDGRNCLDQIAVWIRKQDPGSLVLLVDEYDAPLNSHLDKPEFFHQIRDMLSGFFSLVKSSDRAWRFVFITGIAKFNKSSIFSAFNNLEDISLDPDYGTLLGYTEEEILDNFKLFLDNAAKINKIEAPTLMKAMREKYDGFCFDSMASTHVYAPWSVLSFLKKPHLGLQNYWYESAGMPSLIMNYIERYSIEKPEFFACPHNVSLRDLRGTNTLESLKPEVFLFQAGYLSIKDCQDEEVVLGYPNKEMEESMTQLYVDHIVGGKTFIDMGVGSIKRLLAKGNPEEAVTAFNKIFLNIPYDKYPVTSESVCRMAIQMILTGAGIYSDLEKQNSFGRSDLEFSAGDFHWVMEFKYLHRNKNDNPDTLLDEALQQIKEKHYGEGLDIGNKKLLRVGLVFDGTAREFVRFGVV